MKAEQIVLPFRLTGGTSVKEGQGCADLIGQSFHDGRVTLSVIGVCPSNPNQVIVQRDLDQKSWAAPAWLIRTIVGQKKKKRRAA